MFRHTWTYFWVSVPISMRKVGISHAQIPIDHWYPLVTGDRPMCRSNYRETTMVSGRNGPSNHYMLLSVHRLQILCLAFVDRLKWLNQHICGVGLPITCWLHTLYFPCLCTLESQFLKVYILVSAGEIYSCPIGLCKPFVCWFAASYNLTFFMV